MFSRTVSSPKTVKTPIAWLIIFPTRPVKASCEAVMAARFAGLIVMASSTLRSCWAAMGVYAKPVMASILLELPSPTRTLAVRRTRREGTSHLMKVPTTPPMAMKGTSLLLIASKSICES